MIVQDARDRGDGYAGLGGNVLDVVSAIAAPPPRGIDYTEDWNRLHEH